MIRVLLADDRAATRAALRMRLALEPDVQVIGEAVDGCAVLQLAALLHPDVVIMDLQMPCLDGISATEQLRTQSPLIAVVIISINDSQAARTRARESGAAAFVGKHETDEPLLAAIRQAAPQ